MQCRLFERGDAVDGDAARPFGIEVQRIAFA
jgi:hypothetical protein